MFRFVMAAAVMALPALAVDGTTLINQSTVMAAGGFPYHVTQSGSYKLSGNLVSNGPALLITASNVALDLNGFTISCSASCGSSGIGSTGNGTTIMNGTVTGFSTAGGAGINLSGSGATVDRVNVINNNVGINAGSDLLVTNSKVMNGTYGIYGPSVRMTILNSIISGQAQDAIDILDGLVSGNTISNNGNGGTFTRGGILLYGGTVNITNNAILNNIVFGIGLGNSSLTGVAGYGSNTFGGNTVDAVGTTQIVSMHNNACGGGSC